MLHQPVVQNYLIIHADVGALVPWQYPLPQHFPVDHINEGQINLRRKDLLNRVDELSKMRGTKLWVRARVWELELLGVCSTLWNSSIMQ